MKVRCFDIDYYIGYEDVEMNFEAPEDILDDSEAWEDWCDARIAEIRKDLPDEVIVEVDDEPEDLEYELSEAISNETGWLINAFSYELIK